MEFDEQQLWNKIANFQIDADGIAFTFSQRLARDNGWTRAFTSRVIEEYKKFLFLCCISKNGVTPSDPVDQAWHLHLTYTRSYWVEFCRNTVGKEIHHNPTKGGNNEAEKFGHFYADTNQLYKEKFGKEPPKDIWPNSKTRFTDVNFKRVNLKDFWLIRKPGLPQKKFSVLLGILLAALVSIQAEFDLSFLILPFVVVVFLIVVLAKKKDKDKPGCSTSSCGSGGSHSTNKDNGCNGGCSDGGCSGCGGD